MAKLQPQFSWQKYEGQPEDQKQQFQYQLQQHHVLISNSINATIDDISYFSRQRATSETWIDNRQIYKLTLSGTIVGSADTSYTHGIVGLRTFIKSEGSAQNAIPMTVKGIPLPYID